MRKFSMILILILLILGCALFIFGALNASDEYDDWQEIQVKSIGTFKLPNAWEYQEKDNVVYITQKVESGKPVVLFLGAIKGEKDLFALNGYEIEYIDLISSEVFSNSATVGEKEYLISGTLCKRFFLDFYSSNGELSLIACENTVEYDLLRKIGKSFVME